MNEGQIKQTGTYDLALEIEKNGYETYKNNSASIVSEF